jgi:hypothetical protein
MLWLRSLSRSRCSTPSAAELGSELVDQLVEYAAYASINQLEHHVSHHRLMPQSTEGAPLG